MSCIWAIYDPTLDHSQSFLHSNLQKLKSCDSKIPPLSLSMSSSNTAVFIDHVLGQITSSNNVVSLNHALKTGLQRESKETVLCSFLSNGQDPLQILDVRAHTLGVLYILWVPFLVQQTKKVLTRGYEKRSSRVSASFTNTLPPPWPVLDAFCRHFNPDHARLAPERGMSLFEPSLRGIGFSGLFFFLVQ